MAEINLLEKTLERVEKREYCSRTDEIKRICEALLFASSDPVSMDRLKEIVNTLYPVKTRELRAILQQMQEDYQKTKRAFQIDEIGGGYLLRTVEELAPYVALLQQDRRSEKLSNAATEVLAIVAYRGPITRPEIEALRGVDSSGTLASLIERGLVKGVGRREAPGRPMEYATTTEFLKHFGLRDIRELSQL